MIVARPVVAPMVSEVAPPPKAMLVAVALSKLKRVAVVVKSPPLTARSVEKVPAPTTSKAVVGALVPIPTKPVPLGMRAMWLLLVVWSWAGVAAALLKERIASFKVRVPLESMVMASPASPMVVAAPKLRLPPSRKRSRYIREEVPKSMSLVVTGAKALAAKVNSAAPAIYEVMVSAVASPKSRFSPDGPRMSPPVTVRSVEKRPAPTTSKAPLGAVVPMPTLPET